MAAPRKSSSSSQRPSITSPSTPPRTQSSRAISNSSSQGFSSSDRNATSTNRRWQAPFASGSSIKSGVGSGENGNTRKSSATYSLSRGGRESAWRPSSADTVDSFSSAKPFSSSDTSSFHAKTTPTGPRSSTSSSNARTPFEEMLASGETWRISETAEVAKSDSGRSLDSREQHETRRSLSEKRSHNANRDDRKEAVVPEVVEEEDRLYDDSLQQTPTLGSFPSPTLLPKSPLRPPKSSERSPSVNSQIMSTFPSTISDLLTNSTSSALASPKDLPIHPHHRDDRGEEQKQQQTKTNRYLNADLSRSEPLHSQSTVQTLGPSLPVRAMASSKSSAGLLSPNSQANFYEKAGASPGLSNSSQSTFTTLQPMSEAQETQQSHLESGSSHASPSEKSSGALKQKFKKTSGFFKRLGGGASTGKTKATSPMTLNIARKPSHSSLESEGGASIAQSTKSAPGVYQNRRGTEKKVPVPSIPSRFIGGLRTNNRFLEGTESGSSNGPQSANGLPASESMGSQLSPQSKMNHGHDTPSSAAGSTGSATTDLKHALKAWEIEMDATLKQSGQHLETKTKIEKPSTYWSPSPQLPEYKLNRKASFMDEGDDPTELSAKTTSDSIPRKPSSYESQYLSPFQTQRTLSLGLGLPSSSAQSQATIIHSDPISSTPTFPSNPHHDSSNKFAFRFQRSRDDNFSQTSTKSYETAIDRPSFFLRQGHREEAGVKDKSLAEEPPAAKRASQEDDKDGDDDMDPEKSIRLISPTSHDSEVGQGNTIKSPGLEVIEEAGGHTKEKTLMQSDVTSTPAVREESEKISQAVQEMDSEENVDSIAKASALKCWNEDEAFKRKEKIAEWLGGITLTQQSARVYYMDQFDFTELRIDAAFRRLCDKLFLRAETQQVDRILSAFSRRYSDCNPQSILLNTDVVHALVFSILLLNTDLHVADIQDRMTRNQFVRNTLAAILESSEVGTAQTWTNGEASLRHDDTTSQSSLNVSVDSPTSTHDLPGVSSTRRLTPSRRVSNDGTSTAGSDARGTSDSTRSPFNKAWEVEMEGLLKDIYTSVKSNQIRLPITDSTNLTSILPRKNPRIGSDRVNALKRGSIRGFQGLLGGNVSQIRSEESLSASRTSLNSTQRSLSDYNTTHSTPSTSLTSGSVYGVPPTLGFANTLSQSIIKEAKDEDDSRSIDSTNDDFTDDELALMGPPWAKEGMLTRKHYWEAPLKRAKDKTWNDCFVVVQKGVFSMFRFGDQGSGNLSNTSSASVNAGIGGGNWLSNATHLGEFSLAHTLANSLPPPGYNRSRPHVFALTLPNGSVFFFQTGHEELVQEWVSTCNYWAARQSKEPYAVGVSNMEYGWNRVMPTVTGDDDDDEEEEEEEEEEEVTSSSHLDLVNQPRPSINTSSDTRSIRSGKSGKSLRMRVTNNGVFQSWQMNADRSLASPVPSFRASSTFQSHDRPIFINEWRPPAPPTLSSTLSEEDQLEACKRHKSRVEAELVQHNLLRKPMLDYLGSMPNLSTASMNKAISNFDKKASYLLSDLTKFTLYTATLASANKLKLEKRDARQLNRMMLKADEELSRVKTIAD